MFCRKKCSEDSHRFEPRYDEVAPNWLQNVEGINGRGISVRRMLYERHYVYDICVRCGKTIKR